IHSIIPLIFIIYFLSSLITINSVSTSQNFDDARNSQRSSDVLQILNAVTQYTSEQGNLLLDLGDIAYCNERITQIGSGSGNVDLASKLVPDYISDIPTDPSGGTAQNTGYTICEEPTGKVRISAPNSDNNQNITVLR
ncbi:hypothetical protein KC669_03710, partial [Candidatus Dojkabacteria bacterium]|nr:hypothetical protein [Candidatus Dojkabacteria bacterium]